MDNLDIPYHNIPTAVSYLCDGEPKYLHILSISDKYDVIYISIQNKKWNINPNNGEASRKRLDIFFINLKYLDLKFRYTTTVMNFN